MRCLFVLISFFYTSCLYAQELSHPFPGDSSIITIKAFYKGYGKVFKGNNEANRDVFGNQYPHPFVSGYKADAVLSAAEIIRAEQTLFEKYNQLLYNKYKLSPVKDVRKRFFRYYRQYVGFYNAEGDKMVLIHLMNFKQKRKAKQYFDSWDHNLSIGNGGFYESNQETFVVNLSKNELNFY